MNVGHGLHAVRPSGEKVPGTHSVHALAAPDELDPGAQVRQRSAPLEGLYVPDPQAVHCDPPCEYVPAKQI